jgi:transcription elongation factor Elf1
MSHSGGQYCAENRYTWDTNSTTVKRGISMATYECKVCGMSVNATCGKCDAPLENGTLKVDENTEVQISECPNGHGKIKSPLCCGQDMTCTI